MAWISAIFPLFFFSSVDPTLHNNLFGEAGQPGSGTDLLAININRGRDQGMAAWCSVREALGLPSTNDWNALSQAPYNVPQAYVTVLKQLYDNPCEIDLEVGLLMEPHVSDGLSGETQAKLIAYQHKLIQCGDRYWFENRRVITILLSLL